MVELGCLSLDLGITLLLDSQSQIYDPIVGAVISVPGNSVLHILNFLGFHV
jgi:hypothetical protein